MARSATPQIKTRDSDCCSVNFVKYVLHIFNIVFFLSGVAVLGVAIWTIFWKHKYVSLLTSYSYVFGAYGLFLAGVFALIGGVIGWCGVWRENRAILLCYTFVMVIVFLLETTVGSVSYFYESQVSKELNATLNDTFVQHYGLDKARTEAIDLLQQDFGCCGAVRFEDWRQSMWIRSRRKDLLMPPMGRVVPDSCCVSMTELCGLRDHPSNIPYTGCIYQMTEDLREHLNILGAVGLGVCCVEIFGMILSCTLYIKLKDIYEDDD